jgi:hypothetical protein
MAERERLLQVDQRGWLDRVGTEEWTTVYHSEHESDHSILIYCALLPKRRVKQSLRDFSFDLSVGDARPSCYQHGDKVGYERWGNSAGIEPLVLVRLFDDHRPNGIELLEEFRLFHDLTFDVHTNTYVKVDDAGREHIVARVSDNHVEMQTYPLRQFLAIKNMHLSIGIDSRVYSTLPLDEIAGDDRRREVHSDTISHLLCVNDCDFKEGARTFSRVIGKRLVAALPKEQSGVWPYVKDKPYEEFIIGRDADGSERQFTCDPERLANFFGANPRAPQQITPVFFRPDVLTKYYAQPGKYAVDDGELRCGSLWALRMDNNQADRIIVFLCDLGHLPHDEQKYWRSFNTAPSGGMSDVHIKRSFLAEFTAASRADLVFKQSFETLQTEWLARFGWPLFLPLLPADRHHFVALRIPMTNEQSEFDGLVLSLTKILNDSINEKQLVASGVLDDATASIGKLEVFLKQQNLPNVSAHIKFLRDLQSLRSTGVGHRKGSKYDKAAAAVGIGAKPLAHVFARLLEQASAFLGELRTHLLAPAATE